MMTMHDMVEITPSNWYFSYTAINVAQLHAACLQGFHKIQQKLGQQSGSRVHHSSIQTLSTLTGSAVIRIPKAAFNAALDPVVSTADAATYTADMLFLDRLTCQVCPQQQQWAEHVCRHSMRCMCWS